ncbi:hypothetical protein NADFUDRAFT_50204 [Nadsonia fulvescens var. elongata DSM 6958]|uniref:Uncharacterized protein n=1 Tax=Nadsonia fulvescens var. elongata DSM 6958 TaxID=857566 RepID=A0A1E3PM67_9ASCO|nr:hypothetical protein NADFUDRAFT_50204 [Nadsonia fulvescens var. elongata DSM 6958]
MFKISIPLRRLPQFRCNSTSAFKGNGLVDEIFCKATITPKDRYIDPGNRWMTDIDPMVTDHKKLKGTKADVVQLLYETGLLKATPRVHACKYFRAWFFPTSHFVSLFRKSKPAIHIGTGPVEPYNGVKFDAKDDFNVRSHVPTDYAVYRTQIKRSVKRAFMVQFLANTESPDGLYFIQTLNVMPSKSGSELEPEMQKMINSSIRLTRPDQNLDWIAKANSRVKENKLDRICIQNHFPKVQLSSLPILSSSVSIDRSNNKAQYKTTYKPKSKSNIKTKPNKSAIVNSDHTKSKPKASGVVSKI